MKKIKGLIVLFFILIFLQFILWVQSPSEVIVSFLKYYSCSIYLFCIVLLLVVKDVDSLLYTFYVLAFGVFIMSRVFLDALGFEDAYFYVSTWANDWSYFSLSIQFEMLNSIIFYLLFSFVGFLSSCLFVDRYNYKMCVKNDSLIFEIRRLGFFLFISFCVPYLLYLYQAVKFVVENGYLAVYLNESSTTVDNPILRISDDLCVAGIYLYLSTFPIGKKYILVSCFYIFTLLILLGTGGRSATFTQVLAFLVYLGIRGIRVNWRWMLRFVLIGFSLIYVAQLVNDFRDSGFKDLDQKKDDVVFTQLIQSFFWQQGTSIQTIGRTIQYVDEVANGWLYFVGPITNSFRENRLMEYLGLGIPNGQTLGTVREGYSWADWLSYKVSPRYYLNGHGMGSSAIAESYLLGNMFGVMIVGYMCTFIIMRFAGRCKKKYSYMYILFYVLPVFFMFPRAEPLSVITALYRPFCVLFCVQLIYWFKRKYKLNCLFIPF